MNKEVQKSAGNGKLVTGKVVSVSSPKTVVVAVESYHRHPLYRKAVRKTKKFLAENTGLELIVGETIRMKEVPPISKKKHYLIIEKLT
jgi:small subunit ribosomal protein S17